MNGIKKKVYLYFSIKFIRRLTYQSSTHFIRYIHVQSAHENRWQQHTIGSYRIVVVAGDWIVIAAADQIIVAAADWSVIAASDRSVVAASDSDRTVIAASDWIVVAYVASKMAAQQYNNDSMLVIISNCEWIWWSTRNLVRISYEGKFSTIGQGAMLYCWNSCVNPVIVESFVILSLLCASIETETSGGCYSAISPACSESTIRSAVNPACGEPTIHGMEVVEPRGICVVASQ